MPKFHSYGEDDPPASGAFAAVLRLRGCAGSWALLARRAGTASAIRIPKDLCSVITMRI
jgi:hypothetical protein